MAADYHAPRGCVGLIVESLKDLRTRREDAEECRMNDKERSNAPWELVGGWDGTGVYRPDRRYEVRTVGGDPDRFELVNKVNGTTDPLHYSGVIKACNEAETMIRARLGAQE